jgi:enamine deaminase RidA (YjgF/YER057c/UK114 family)
MADRRVDFVRPAGLYTDAPYSYAAVAPPGRLVFTAGACPLDPDGIVVGPGDVETQARTTVANLLVALDAAGAGAGDVVKTTVYVVASSRDDLVKVWTVVKAAFEPFAPPSTLLGVALLGYRDQLVEIEAVALALPPSEPASAP